MAKKTRQELKELTLLINDLQYQQEIYNTIDYSISLEFLIKSVFSKVGTEVVDI